MASDELDATTDVVTLAEHADGLGTSTARRLENNGIETVADILIAEEGTLTDIPYVSHLRADTLRELAEEIADDINPDPLVDSREVILEATLGEKLNITMAERDGYANTFAVIDTEEAIAWEPPTGDSWCTRRIRISQRPTVDESPKECDLVLGADEIRLDDPPVKGEESNRSGPDWKVESVGAVGRVETSTYYQLVGKQQEQDEARPEGDDTWRQYQSRGETA